MFICIFNDAPGASSISNKASRPTSPESANQAIPISGPPSPRSHFRIPAFASLVVIFRPTLEVRHARRADAGFLRVKTHGRAEARRAQSQGQKARCLYRLYWPFSFPSDFESSTIVATGENSIRPGSFGATVLKSCNAGTDVGVGHRRSEIDNDSKSVELIRVSMPLDLASLFILYEAVKPLRMLISVDDFL